MSKSIYDLADQGGELLSLCYELTVSTHVHAHNTKMYKCTIITILYSSGYCATCILLRILF